MGRPDECSAPLLGRHATPNPPSAEVVCYRARLGCADDDLSRAAASRKAPARPRGAGPRAEALAGVAGAARRAARGAGEPLRAGPHAAAAAAREDPRPRAAVPSRRRRRRRRRGGRRRRRAPRRGGPRRARATRPASRSPPGARARGRGGGGRSGAEPMSRTPEGDRAASTRFSAAPQSSEVRRGLPSVARGPRRPAAGAQRDGGTRRESRWKASRAGPEAVRAAKRSAEPRARRYGSGSEPPRAFAARGRAPPRPRARAD